MLYDRKEFPVNAAMQACVERLEARHENAKLLAARGAMRSVVHTRATDFGDVDFSVKRKPAQRFSPPITFGRVYGKLQPLTQKQTLVTVNLETMTLPMLAWLSVPVLLLLTAVLLFELPVLAWLSVMVAYVSIMGLQIWAQRRYLVNTVNTVFDHAFEDDAGDELLRVA